MTSREKEVEGLQQVEIKGHDKWGERQLKGYNKWETTEMKGNGKWEG